MSSYLSGLLTTTTSRYASFRGMITTSENDGDTSDDTHLCRVMRSYYTEKGRGFPGWLPPDPKAPAPVQAAYAQPMSNVGAGYGGGLNNTAGGNKLGSLWDSQPPGGAAQQSASLRQGRGVPQQAGVQPGRRPDLYNRTQPADQPVLARPLPSQRAGSYQANPNQAPQSQMGASSAGGGSAQDRLKARLRGGVRAGSPGPQPQLSSSASYEDSFAPRGAEKPFVAAGSPWASSAQEMPQQGRASPMGLPAGGPRSGGLPRGPRPQR